MTGAPTILLIDSHAADRTLSRLILERQLPHAVIKEASTAPALAEELVSVTPDAAVVAADLRWTTISSLVDTLRRRKPRTSVVLFGRKADILTRVLTPGLACDGIVRKSSRGFMSLGPVISSALSRPGGVGFEAGVEVDRSGKGLPGAAGSMPPEAAHARSDTPASREDSLNEIREIALLFSHDLREPAQQLVRLARQGHTADGRPESPVLARVLERAERLSRMLDRMTEYLVVTGRMAKPALIDLSECLEQAIDLLRPSIVEAEAEVRVMNHRLMSMGDEQQIVHLFQNLISNALKFRDSDRPVITISAERRGDRWLMRFRDNGIGIPESSTERIFELGTRLHSDRYPGAGMGLALCKRIVERHGGRIWVESRTGEGSTFLVLLPAVEAQARAL
jgi:signal transduction histidine kinase